MKAYSLLLRDDPREAEWVLARDGPDLSLTAPDGQVVFRAVPAHRAVDLNQLYGEGKISFPGPGAPLAFRKHLAARAALRAAVEIGMAGDAEFRGDLRRQSLRNSRDGLAVGVAAGGLFALYCWWAFTTEDPAPGTWLAWVLRWFGWLIHGALLALLGAALAGPCVIFSGFRQWWWVWRIGRSAAARPDAVGPGAGPERPHPWAPGETSLAEPAEPGRTTERARLACPKCGSARVDELPPSQISPHPGYCCGDCGAKMRAPGMLVLYLVGLALGIGFASFLYLPFAAGGNPLKVAQVLAFAGPGLVCAGYSLLQLTRPVPGRARADGPPPPARETWG